MRFTFVQGAALTYNYVLGCAVVGSRFVLWNSFANLTCLGNSVKVERMLLQLAELAGFVEGALCLMARSVAGLRRTMKAGLSPAMGMDKASIVVPDGTGLWRAAG